MASKTTAPSGPLVEGDLGGLVVHEFSTVIDQCSTQKFKELSPEVYKSITKLYLEKFGKLRDYEDPTLLQLSALAAKLALDKVPCVDFSIWGPFGRRLQKLMRFISDVFVGGVLTRRQIMGPQDFF